MINVSSIAKTQYVCPENRGYLRTNGRHTLCPEKGRFYGQVVFSCFVRGKADFTDRFPYVRRKILGHMLRIVKS